MSDVEKLFNEFIDRYGESNDLYKLNLFVDGSGYIEDINFGISGDGCIYEWDTLEEGLLKISRS